MFFYDYFTLATFCNRCTCNICALFNTRDLWYYNFQAVLACSEKSSENSSEGNQAFCLMQNNFFVQSRSRAYET